MPIVLPRVAVAAPSPSPSSSSTAVSSISPSPSASSEPTKHHSELDSSTTVAIVVSVGTLCLLVGAHVILMRTYRSYALFWGSKTPPPSRKARGKRRASGEQVALWNRRDQASQLPPPFVIAGEGRYGAGHGDDDDSEEENNGNSIPMVGIRREPALVKNGESSGSSRSTRDEAAGEGSSSLGSRALEESVETTNSETIVREPSARIPWWLTRKDKGKARDGAPEVVERG